MQMLRTTCRLGHRATLTTSQVRRGSSSREGRSHARPVLLRHAPLKPEGAGGPIGRAYGHCGEHVAHVLVAAAGMAVAIAGRPCLCPWCPSLFESMAANSFRAAFTIPWLSRCGISLAVLEGCSDLEVARRRRRTQPHVIFERRPRSTCAGIVGIDVVAALSFTAASWPHSGTVPRTIGPHATKFSDTWFGATWPTGAMQSWHDEKRGNEESAER